jgi:hypothetical protein
VDNVGANAGTDEVGAVTPGVASTPVGGMPLTELPRGVTGRCSPDSVN